MIIANKITLPLYDEYTLSFNVENGLQELVLNWLQVSSTEFYVKNYLFPFAIKNKSFKTSQSVVTLINNLSHRLNDNSFLTLLGKRPGSNRFEIIKSDTLGRLKNDFK